MKQSAVFTREFSRSVAQYVYLDSEIQFPAGWELDESFGDTSTGMIVNSVGLFAYALRPTFENASVDKNQRIIAFRGTEGGLVDLYSDISSIGKGQFDSETSEEVNRYIAAEILLGHDVHLIGHSLGGALVQWAIESENLGAITREMERRAEGRSIPDLTKHLSFDTFNAPGITYAPGADPDSPRSSPISGTHYVIALSPWLANGDPIHILGGRPVGGDVVGLAGDGFMAHSILNESGIWDSPIVKNYEPPFVVDASTAQEIAKFVEQLHGMVNDPKEPMSELEAGLKLALILSWTGAVYTRMPQFIVAAALTSVATITQTLATKGFDSIFDGVRGLIDQAKKSNADVGDLVVGLVSFVADAITQVAKLPFTTSLYLIKNLGGLLIDVAKGVANSFVDLEKKHETTFDLGTETNAEQYRQLAQAFNIEGDKLVNGQLADAIKDAQAIVNAGGEQVALLSGITGNPFNDTALGISAAPALMSAAETAAVASAELKRWSVKTFTLSLPYEPAKDGQGIRLRLSGAAAQSLVLLHPDLGRMRFNGEEGVILTIEPGQTQLTFSLLVEDEITEAGTVTLSAALVDAAGVQTHRTVQSLPINVQAGEPSDEPTVEPVLTQIFGTGVTKVVDGVTVSYTDYQGDDTGNLVITGDGPNRVWVGDGTNSVVGGSGDDSVYSGSGDSTIRGGNGNDYIYTNGGGDNLIEAGGGKDVVVAGFGHNRIYAGAETDIQGAITEAASAQADGSKGAFITVTDGDNTIVGGSGDDAILLGGGNNLVIAGAGRDTIVGGQSAGGVTGNWDVRLVEASAGYDLVYDNVSVVRSSGGYATDANYQGNVDPQGNPLGNGNNTIIGGSGDHVIVLSNGDNYVDVGSGDSMVLGGMGADTILGGAGKTSLNGAGGDDYINAGSGQAEIWGGSGNNVIYGGDGNSTIYAGTGGTDWASRNEGNSLVQAGKGDTVIYGAGGNDTLLGGSGNDTILAGDGNTLIFGGGGVDHIEGGAGINVIHASDGGTATNAATVLAGEGATTVYGGKGVTHIQGGSGENILHAGAGGDRDAPTIVQAGSGNTTIYGGSGINILRGGAGDDLIHAGIGGTKEAPTVLIAGSGNDTLVAGSGHALLYAGEGHTSFVLNPQNGNTTIAESKITDTIVFDEAVNPTDVTITAQLYENGNVSLVLNTGYSSTVIMNGMESAAEQFAFASAGTLNLQQLFEEVTSIPQHIVGPSGEIAFSAANGAVLAAQGANSKLFAFGANSTMIGGDGDSVMRGGGGATNYVVNSDTGETVIIGSVASDRLKLGAGIDAVDIQVDESSGSGDSVTINLAGGGSIVIKHTEGALLDTLEFADGGVTSLSDLMSGNASITYPDGSYSLLSTDALGTVNATRFSADGTRLSDSWRAVDGSSGSSAFNPDGSSTGTVSRADGSTSTVANDGNGTVTMQNYNAYGVLTGTTVTVTDANGETTTNFDPSGRKTGVNWTRTDGTYGWDTYAADGFVRGVVYRPDGSFSMYTDDGHGNVDTINYDAQGNVIDSEHAGEDSGVRIDNPDGSYRVVVDDGEGNTSVAYFDIEGTRYRESWTRVDGSRGENYINADGSGSGTQYAADGSSSTFTRNAFGHTITTNFDWLGNQTDVVHGQTNGLNNVVTTFRDLFGSKVAETWTHSDGLSGSNVLDNVDFIGRATYATRQPGQSYARWDMYTETGGADGVNSTHVDMYGNNWNGRLYGGVFGQAFGRDLGWGGYGLYASTWETPYSRQVGSVYLESYTANTSFETMLFTDGSRRVYGISWGSGIPSTIMSAASTVPMTMTIRGTTGLLSTYYDDGQGNLVLTDYNASGARSVVMWIHNDSSYGFDFYNADGSMAGVAVDMYGSATRYIKLADGTMTRQTVAPLPVDTTYTVEPDTSYLPPPMLGSAPRSGSGLWSNPQMTVPNGEGGTITLNFSFFGGISQNSVNLATGKTKIVSPKRSGGAGQRSMFMATALADEPESSGTSGWQFDASGAAASSFVDDGMGTVTTYDYDTAGRVMGYARANSSSNGTTTMRYDASGQLVGKSVLEVDANGVETTTNFDAAGNKTSSQVTVSDSQGNSVSYSFNAAGEHVATRTTEVTGDNEVTITDYDGQGNATGGRVMAYQADGSVYTANYGADGALTGSSLRRVADNGMWTANYGATGQLLGYHLLSPDNAGGVRVRAYDSGGMLVSDSQLSALNELVNAVHDDSGTRRTTTYYADLSYEISVEDVVGNVTTTTYSQEGAKLSRSWSKVAGESGWATFDSHGLESGTISRPNGATSSYSVAANGTVTTLHFNYWGSLQGKTVQTNTDGARMTEVFDAYGRKLRDEWLGADGSSGTGTYGTDGSRILKTFDGFGGTTSKHFNAAGTLTAEAWTRADGSSGVTDFYPDGSYKISVLDAAGNSRSTLYNAAGDTVSVTWSNADGSMGTDTFHQDGSWTRVANDGRGTLTTTEYDESGRRLSDTWASTNGQSGTNTYHIDGSAEGSIAYPGGMVGTSTVNPDGSYTMRWVETNGKVTTAQYNENGFMLGKQWTAANGSSGSYVFAPPAATPTVAQPLRDTTVGEASQFVVAIPVDTFVESVAGNTLSYTVTLADGRALPDWLEFDPATGTLSGTSPDGDVAPLYLKITAIEDGGLRASTTFKLTVSDVSAPVLNKPLADQETDELVEYRFAVPADTFVDLDQGELTYSATLADGSPLPSWLQFDPATATFSGIPGDELVGTSVEVQVTAQDPHGLTASDAFRLKINALETLYTAVSIALPSHVSNLVGTGSADLVLTGNGLANVITANDGNDTLVAGSGPATLVGGIGNDTFVINKETDVVIEAAGSDVNTLVTPVSYVLPENVQHLKGSGSADITLTGNSGAHVITANSGNDTLIAGTGAATLIGGAGDDTFIINKASDVVVEQAGNGNNTLITAVSYTLPEHVQSLRGAGDQGLVLEGNSTAHAIHGGSGDDTLVAGTGSATMLGGQGDDTYIVNNSLDTIIEQAAGGNDVVFTSVDFVLPANVEQVTGTGSADLVLTGNEGTHVLVANSGNDTLIAGGGAATLVGGGGNNTFVISSDQHDVVAQAGGINNVITSVDYVAGAHVHNIMASGYTGLRLEGNTLDNEITGQTGNDTLIAGGGRDILAGGAGNDILVGGAGSTTYAYRVGDGMDAIVAGEGTDTVRFAGQISLANTRIRLTHADGTPYAVVKDGNSGRIHGARPNHTPVDLVAHVEILGQDGNPVPGQGLTLAVSADENGWLTSTVDAFEFADGSTAGFAQLVTITRQGDWNSRSGSEGEILWYEDPGAGLGGRLSSRLPGRAVLGSAATEWSVMDAQLNLHLARVPGGGGELLEYTASAGAGLADSGSLAVAHDLRRSGRGGDTEKLAWDGR